LNYLDIALETARTTGEWIRTRLESEIQIKEKESSFDLVTDVDQEAENMIKRQILKYFPKHKFLGEETAFCSKNINTCQSLLLKELSDEFVWVVDPIDGTTNFVHRLPGFTISIALIYRGDVYIGVIYDPINDEMFWAQKGKGAFLNHKRIQVSKNEKIEESVVATGFPSDITNDRDAVIRSINKIGPRCRNLRVYGSAALHLSYTATGRLGGFWEYGLNIWDIAAGILLVQEAGGTISNTLGQTFQFNMKNILVSNGIIHEDMLSELRKIEKTMDIN
jgi:myo-inositol-1(or 4)-monophosphatase